MFIIFGATLIWSCTKRQPSAGNDVSNSSVDSLSLTTSSINSQNTTSPDTISDSWRAISSCNLFPSYISGAGLAIGIQEINENEYRRLSPENLERILQYPNKHSDSLEKILWKDHKGKFVFKDSCYLFNRGTEQIKICRSMKGEERDYSYYKLVDKIGEYFVFESVLYEDGFYTLFDPKSGRAFNTSGYPRLSHIGKYVYSTSSAYAEATISIHRLPDQKEIVVSFKDWDPVSNYYIGEEGIRFSLRRAECRKYIDIHFAN